MTTYPRKSPATRARDERAHSADMANPGAHILAIYAQNAEIVDEDGVASPVTAEFIVGLFRDRF